MSATNAVRLERSHARPSAHGDRLLPLKRAAQPHAVPSSSAASSCCAVHRCSYPPVPPSPPLLAPRRTGLTVPETDATTRAERHSTAEAQQHSVAAQPRFTTRSDRKPCWRRSASGHCAGRLRSCLPLPLARDGGCSAPRGFTHSFDGHFCVCCSWRTERSSTAGPRSKHPRSRTATATLSRCSACSATDDARKKRGHWDTDSATATPLCAARSSRSRRCFPSDLSTMRSVDGVAILPLLLALVSLLAAVSPAAAAPGSFSYSANISSTDDVPCIPSMFCPGGQTGRLCAKGHFCPTVLDEWQCPSGHYCPPGSTRPRPCSVVESCPAGSYRYLNWGCLVLLIVLLPLLAVSGCLYDWIRRRSSASKRSSYQIVTTTDNGNGAGRLFIQSPSPRPAGGAAAEVENGPSSPSASPDAPCSTLQRVPRMEIRFSAVAASIPVNGVMKPILSDVTGHFRAGRLISVMGPSGAGA